MSAMDRFEDGYPHSTREGYDGGCRGSACPGKLDNGFSCSDAYRRYQGDFAFRKMVEAGLSPAEIAEAEKPAEPAPKKRAPRTPKPPVVGSNVLAAETVHVEDSREPEDEKHGTPYGYQRGCHDSRLCPAEPSCREAYLTYHREYSARYRELLRRGEVVPGPSRSRRAEAVSAAAQVLMPSSDELQRDLARRDARIAELEQQLVATRAAAWSTLIEKAGVDGATVLRIEILGGAA